MLEEIVLNIPAIISRWLHLVAVIVAVGGTVFIRLVLHPSAQAALDDETRGSLRAVIIRRWARFIHVAILIIILSGVYNIVVVFPTLDQALPYHPLLGVKLLLALALFFVATAITGKSAAFEGMRKQTPRWMTVNIVLAACIVLISNVLKNISSSLGG